jgi:hypothetical protein
MIRVREKLEDVIQQFAAKCYELKELELDNSTQGPAPLCPPIRAETLDQNRRQRQKSLGEFTLGDSIDFGLTNAFNLGENADALKLPDLAASLLGRSTDRLREGDHIPLLDRHDREPLSAVLR